MSQDYEVVIGTRTNCGIAWARKCGSNSALEATQVVLGHASANVSEIYAERDLSLAAEIMRKIG